VFFLFSVVRVGVDWIVCDRFMKYWNVSVSVLDPAMHNAKSVLARCPFLFTVGKSFLQPLRSRTNMPALTSSRRCCPRLPQAALLPSPNAGSQEPLGARARRRMEKYRDRPGIHLARHVSTAHATMGRGPDMDVLGVSALVVASFPYVCTDCRGIM